MMSSCLILTTALAGSGADAPWPWVPDSSQHSLGQHRALLQIPEDTSGDAVWVEVPWQRRAIPDAATTDIVLTVAKTGQVVANALRAPISGVPESEAVNLIFEPQIVDDVDWIENHGTADASILTACSGAYETTPCWKVVDGVFAFDYNKGQGWDGEPEKGTTLEWLEFDLGVVEKLDRLGIYSVSPGEDQHFPIHNPATIALLSRDSIDDSWQQFFNGTASEADTNIFSWGKSQGPVETRYIRLEIRTRHVASQQGAHSWLKEIQFGRWQADGKRRVATDYALYFMPYSWTGSPTGLGYQAHWDPVNESASADWRQDNDLSDTVLASQSYEGRLPTATLVRFESQTIFDSFEPMEIVAKSGDRKELLAAHSDDVFWFPEDRSNQVKMFDVIPQRWIEAGPSKRLQGTADPGELYAMQLGFWAARAGLVLDSSNVSWSALSDDSGKVVVSENSITCYNLGGRDYRGREFSQTVRFDQGQIGALWFGISVPSSTAAGKLVGSIFVGQTAFSVELTVSSNEPIANAGTDDVWRMARLSWLNSAVGIDRNITAGFDPVKLSVDQDVASIDISGNRSLVIAGNDAGDSMHLIRSISVKEIDVLSAPLSFIVQGLTLNAVDKPIVTQSDDMTATFMQQACSIDGSINITSSIIVSYDGFIDITLSLASSSGRNVGLEDTKLSVIISPAASIFLMGLGLQGRNRTLMYPEGASWNWKKNKGGQNQLWTGAVDAGLRLKFKGEDYDWESPLHMQTAVPQSWAGDAGDGTVVVTPLDDGSLRITASSGPITVPVEQPLTFKLDLLVTPVKTLDTALHFRRDRYYQYGYNGHGDCATIAGMGTKVLNLHQGTAPNPYINYPFNEVAMEKQANFSMQCKSLGVEKTKIYYTTRELSNRCYEMPALMALSSPQDHFFDDGTGGGPSWLQEHLGDAYHQRWSTGLPDGELDAAIADTSLTRWVNYYIEGLRWLSENHPGTAAIDGLYLDEVSFDRATMQRMRKAVDERREGSLFDLHSCNKYHCGRPSPHASSALIYMAHFAFIDSLWFGEDFSADSPADQWLVEMSGIPFGLHAEQLSRPNLWRGMVFAEGARPAPELWAAWDSLELTMDGTRLVGWWDAAVPARSDHPDVLVSVYLRPNGRGCVLAIASWAAETTEVHLDINWQALGLDVAVVSINAPAIKNFQPAAAFSAQHPMVTVDPKKGWLLDLRPASQAAYV